MNLMPTALSVDTLFFPVVWEKVFREAKGNNDLQGLIQQLQNLPCSEIREIRLLECQYHLSRTNQKAIQHIIRKLSQYPANPLAQGLRFVFQMENSSNARERKRILEHHIQHRHKLQLGMYLTDAVGLGMYAMVLAGEYAAAGDRENATREIAEARKYFLLFNDQNTELKLQYQEVRLHFALGEYPQVIEKGLRLLQAAQSVNESLCLCIREVVFWASLLSGQFLYDLFSYEEYRFIRERENFAPYLASTHFLGDLMMLYARTVGFMDRFHQVTVLVNHGDFKKDIAYLASQVEAAVTHEYDEVGELLATLCCALVDACQGKREGLKKAMAFDEPFVRNSLVLGIFKHSVILEASMLLSGYGPLINVQPSQQVVMSIHTLPRMVRTLLMSWMYNLTPHVLVWLEGITRQQDGLKDLHDELNIYCDELLLVYPDAVKQFDTQKKIKGYWSVVDGFVASSIKGEALLHSQYNSGRNNCMFMEENTYKRVVFNALLSAIKAKLI